MPSSIPQVTLPCLVHGETLSDMIEDNPLPLDAAVALGESG